MKRGQGFKRPTIERVPTVHRPIPEHLRRNAKVILVCGTDIVLKPKENALESEPYRRLVAARPCINCKKPNRSQHAHENEGKGKALKLDDRRAMPLCADEPGIEGCHTKFDQYRLLPGGRPAHVAQGRVWAAETRHDIETEGLWPEKLPRWTECPN
jgi:hypothetical protein